MEQLERIKSAIWYDRISGVYTYEEACDLFELLLVAKNALKREAV